MGGGGGVGGGKARPVHKAGCPKTKEQRTDAILYSVQSEIRQIFPHQIIREIVCQCEITVHYFAIVFLQRLNLLLYTVPVPPTSEWAV
jgi:hypothetical protein